MSMSTRRRSSYAALVFSLFVVAALGLGSCGGDGMEDEPQPIATERCNPATNATADDPAGDEADELTADQTGCKQAKTCKPAGRTCKPSNAAACCSLACICPVGARKCTCG